VWEKQSKQHGFTDYEFFKYNKADSVAKKASKLIDLKPTGNIQIVVLNYEACWRSAMAKALAKWVPDMIILDEAHRAKAPGSSVSRFLHRLGKLSKYKLCLTGTPMSNSPLDLYGQFRFLDDTIFGTSFFNFRGEYAVLRSLNPPIITGWRNTDRLMEKFRTKALECSMEDLQDTLKLPGQLPYIVRAEQLDKESQRIHDELSKEFITDIKDGETLVVDNALTKILRCLEISSGYAKIDEKINSVNHIKIDMLKDVLADLEMQPLVIFCQFREDIRRIKEHLTDREVFELSGKVNELEDWKAAKNAMLVVQMQSGAEGIDLTKAHTAIYYSRNYSLALYEQSKARIYRPGQRFPCRYIHLVIENTFDEHLFQALKDKKNLLDLIKTGNYK